MLRTILIGPGDFPFIQMLAHWLAMRSNFVGAVWTDEGAWQSSWRGRTRFAMRRLQRHGAIKAIDEALFFAYYRAFLRRRDERQVQEIVDNYHAQHGAYRWTGDSIATADVNEPGVLDFLSAHRPDVIFSMCTLNYFRSAIRSIPRLGIFLWHEGITPEYKGTYPAFWAIHNRDFDKLGYTLLKMNHVIDGGDVFVQGPARDVDYQRHGHNYIGHKAVFDSLPDVGQFLLSLEDGTAAPLDRAMSRSGNYTYPGLSDYVRQRLRVRSARNS